MMMMLLLLVVPVWALVLLVVAALCAGARLGDAELDVPTAGQGHHELEARRPSQPSEAASTAYHGGERARIAA